jgi:hypothetical protein
VQARRAARRRLARVGDTLAPEARAAFGTRACPISIDPPAAAAALLLVSPRLNQRAPAPGHGRR